MCFRGVVRALYFHWNIMFIVVFEMFQKFSFFGFQCMMFLFLRHEMEYQLHNAITIYHLYLALSYLVPVIGTLAADLYMHKVMLILLISFFALIGNLLLTLGSLALSAHMLHLLPYVYKRVGLFVGFGLVLRALGGGGVKEIVRALGDDQFDPDEEEWERNKFYQVLHYFMTFGTIFAILALPAMRMHIACFNQVYCFFAAICVPALVILLAYVTLLSGYVHMDKPVPRESVIVEFSFCISAAMNNLWGGGVHWIDNASYAYTEDFLDDMKLTLHALALFMPLPLFWVVFEQIGSLWVYQASNMLGLLKENWNWYVEPDQMQVVNPIVVFIVMPLVSYLLYPMCARSRFFMRTPLPRIFLGGLLLMLAAVVATVVESQVEKIYEKPIPPEEAHLRVWNLFTNCSVTFSITEGDQPVSIEVKSMDYETYVRTGVDFVQPFKYEIKAPTACIDDQAKGDAVLASNGSSYFMQGRMLQIVSFYTMDGEADPPGFMFTPVDDVVVRDEFRCVLQLPLVGLIYSSRKIQPALAGVGPDDQIYPVSLYVKFIPSKASQITTEHFLDPNHNYLDYFHLHPVSYTLGDTGESLSKLRRGAIYMVPLRFFPKNESSWDSEQVTLTPPINMTIWWQLPQYVLLSTAQFLYPMTLLEYAYTQVPLRMRPILLSAWYLSIGFGNLLIAFFTYTISFSNVFLTRQLWWFCLWLGVAILDAIWLFIVICNYTPVEDLEDDDDL